MTGGLLAGGLFGGGLWLVARGLFAPPPPLLRRLGELYEPAPLVNEPGDAFKARWQSWSLRLLTLTGGDGSGQRRDLAVTGQSIERHAVSKLTFTVLGMTLPVLVGLLWTVAGIAVPVALLGLGSLLLGAAGFAFADVVLARAAQARRRDFRYALGSYLELVVIILAGGGGVETALNDAARTGTGWSFAEIRGALAASQLNNDSPWDCLARLAERLGVEELGELASSIALAGTSGARVRESLRAKAMSMRDHELSQAEGEAQAASERMGGPMVMMFVGLIMLIGYPAMATVLAL